VAKHLLDCDFFKQAEHIACYFSVKDELSTEVIFTSLWRTNKHCYLPVVTTVAHEMRFAYYDRTTSLTNNRYNILEPTNPVYFQNQSLDIVLVPLVAFDKKGWRLGMGGGYYDKSFSFLCNKSRPAKPLMIGLAFSQQEADSIPHDDWDVSLDAVITECGIMRFSF
jgi:5-formyltetrahydrofolate cyclo-ligase